jgi:phosphoribosylanthranilate isomerase
LIVGYFYKKNGRMDKKKILVRNISNLSEARYCAGMLVDFISFELDQNEVNFIDLKKFSEIKGWINGIELLGNSVYLTLNEIKELIKERDLDGFIFDYTQINLIELLDCKLKILQIPINQLFTIDENIESKIDYLIIYGEKKDIDKDLLKKVQLTIPIFLGFNFENVTLDCENLSGFAFNGTIELKPGYSSYNDLMDALEFLDQD